MNIGVHQTHCCVKHGCKYANELCPVVLKDIKQDYPCESCSSYGPQLWTLPNEWDLMPIGNYVWWETFGTDWKKEIVTKRDIVRDNPNKYLEFCAAYGPIKLPKSRDPEYIDPDDSDYPF